jgi:hypothetical protein
MASNSTTAPRNSTNRHLMYSLALAQPNDAARLPPAQLGYYRYSTIL